MDPERRVHLSTKRESKPQISNYKKSGDELYDMNNNLTRFTSPINSANDQFGDCEKRNIRNSALKIFGRYRRNKSLSSGNSQVSNVSDSTRKCLSTRSNTSSPPVEGNNRTSFRPFDRRTPRSFTTEQGTVTVLKPVSEFTESCRASYKPLRDSTQSGGQLELESTEQTKTLDCVEASLPCKSKNKTDSQLKRPQEVEAPVALNVIQKAEVQNEKWARQDSPTTESLRSGSSFSRISNSTSSRACQSEISTSRGTSPDLYPPRKSSRYYYPYTNGRLVNIERSSDSVHEVRVSTPPRRREESLSTSPYVFGTGTAKLARSYSGAGVEKPCIIRCSSPSQNSGTNSTSKSSGLYTYRPITPVSANIHNDESQIESDFKGAIHEASWIAPVKSGRASITNVRDNHAYRNPSRSSGLRSICNSPSLSPIFQSASSTSPLSMQSVSLSKIMTVVNLAPDFEQFNKPTLTTIKQKSSRSVLPVAIATPLKYESNDSYNIETSPQHSFRKQQSMHSIRNKDPFLSRSQATPRPENFQSDDFFVKERDINLRLSKMERENAILLAALDGIVRKFSVPDADTSSLKIRNEDEENNEPRRTVGKNANWCEEDKEDYVPRSLREEKRTIFNRVKY